MRETYELGPSDGRLTISTYREGVASLVGHDLVIEVTRWSATATVDRADKSSSALVVKADPRSLEVREGRGGAKPLTDKDRRDIQESIEKVLQAARFPEVTYRLRRLEPRGGDRYAADGELELAGSRRPLRLEVTERPNGEIHADGTLIQSQWGIKPYRGFLGALKVKDAIEVDAEVRLPAR